MTPKLKTERRCAGQYLAVVNGITFEIYNKGRDYLGYDAWQVAVWETNEIHDTFNTLKEAKEYLMSLATKETL